MYHKLSTEHFNVSVTTNYKYAVAMLMILQISVWVDQSAASIVIG